MSLSCPNSSTLTRMDIRIAETLLRVLDKFLQMRGAIGSIFGLSHIKFCLLKRMTRSFCNFYTSKYVTAIKAKHSLRIHPEWFHALLRIFFCSAEAANRVGWAEALRYCNSHGTGHL